MAEVRSEYPYQISFKDERIPGSLIVYRAESAEQLWQMWVESGAIMDNVLAPPADLPLDGSTTTTSGEAGQSNVTPIAPPQPVVKGPACPMCGDETVFKTGTKKDGSPWQGWLCRKGYKVCKGAVWV